VHVHFLRGLDALAWHQQGRPFDLALPCKLQELRIISKEIPHRPGERSHKIFVDFADVHTAAAAINLLQVGCTCV